MIKLRFWYRFQLFLVFLLGLLLSVIPAAIFVWFNYKNVVIPGVNITPLVFAIIAFFTVLIGAVIYFKLFKVKWMRKLQALSVADELGIVPTTPVIFRRLLVMIEWATVPILFYLVILIFKIINKDFSQIHDLAMWLLIGFGIFTVILIVHDYIKISFINKQKIEEDYALQNKVQERYAKRLKSNKKDAIKAAKIKETIEQLEQTLNTEEE